MPSILELYQMSLPITAKVDTKGKDKTPLSTDGGVDLGKESNLQTGLTSKVDIGKYSDRIQPQEK
jgi:hypothetical protein